VDVNAASGPGGGADPAAGRIEPLDRDAALAAAADVGVPHYMTSLSVFRVLLRHPELAKAANDLLSVLLFHGALDVRLRELIIMRVGWTTGSAYEWTQHWRIATELGVPAEDLLGVRDWPAHSGFGPAERAVLAATDETVRDGAVSAGTWEELRAHVGADDALLLEVLGVIGCWRMVSSILRSAEVPLEPGIEPWPPDGVSPGA
jgi:alkylhydroperoxidase family enzyme